jgi:hypothetical protein
MNTKQIKAINGDQFLKDLKSVSDVLVKSHETGALFKVNKKEVLIEAEHNKIKYYITDRVFKVRRNSIVII